MECIHIREAKEIIDYKYFCSECGIVECSACPMPQGCNVCHQTKISHPCNKCLLKSDKSLDVCTTCGYKVCSSHVTQMEDNKIYMYCGAYCILGKLNKEMKEIQKRINYYSKESQKDIDKYNRQHQT